MRVIYLHQYFNTPEMSGGTRSYEMARRLVANGHSVDMITSDCSSKNSDPSWRTTEEAGIRVHWTPVEYSNETEYTDRIRAFLSFAHRAGKRAAELSGDVVFATSTPLTIALPGVHASRRLRAPMVLEVRDLWPEIPIAVGALKNPLTRWSARWLEGHAYRNAARIVALSPGMKDGIDARGYPRENITVIPNSCDIELFADSEERGAAFRAQHPLLGSRKIIAYCGTLGLVNGVDYLVRVAAEMSHDPDVCFLVVGAGRCRSEVERLALDLGVLDKNFIMMDRLPKKDVPAVFAAADMVASTFIDLPCLQANSANKFFDGLAAGKPIAINYRGWQADLLHETGAGLALPPDDPAGAAAAIRNTIFNDNLLERMGRASREVARTKFQRDDLAAQLEDVLLAAVDEGPSRRR